MIKMEIKLEDYPYEDKLATIQRIKTKNETVFNEKYQPIQKMIEYSLWLKDFMKNIYYEESKSTGQTLSDEESIIPILYQRNVDYIFSAFELTKMGFISSSYSIERSVFEVIGKIYLLHLSPIDKELHTKDELGTLNEIEEKEYKKKRYLGPSYVRKSLYTDKKLDDMEELYGDLSKRSHPSIAGAFGSLTEDKDATEDSLDAIFALGISNIIAYWEVYQNKLPPITNNFTHLLNGKLLFDQVPNHPDFVNSIKFKHPIK